MNLLIFTLCLVFSAFFSGMEIAFVSSNKLKLELDKKKNPFYEKIIAYFSNKPHEFIATMLVGNNIALVIFGIYAAEIFEPFIKNYTLNYFGILFIQTFISTAIVLTTAEFFPKSLFRLFPNFFLSIFIIPVCIFYILFYPISKFSISISNKFLKLFKTNTVENKNSTVFTKLDLDELITENLNSDHETATENQGVKFIKNALDFSEIKLKECMKPRAEIVAVEKSDIRHKIMDKFIKSGYSKILVYEETIDNIIGYIHHSVFFKGEAINLGDEIIKPVFVPETMPANLLLSKFLQQRKSIAVVVDEFGGTAGIVTVEDILEEIIGDIEDEHDNNNLIDSKLSDTEFIFSGRLEIDSINEKYGINLPESDQYETVAGMLLFYYENFPKINDIIEFENFKCKVLNTTNRKIHLVRLEVKAKE
jgi:CBS domain containing-hemolysin-like protein